MKTLVFLYNELLDEEYQKKLMLPLEFISYAYMNEVALYDFANKCVAIPSSKRNKVYGALYILDNSEKFLRVLDASLICSKGLIGLNHKLDEFHRVYKLAIPIHFKSVEDFLMLKYNEGEPVRVTTYLGNIENKLIKSKVNNKTRNRVTCGFDINNFINLVIRGE